MVDKGRIEKIIGDFYTDSDRFLVDVRISANNHISVFIDGDNGIKISDCVELSRHIETFFDRDKEDFELEVSSAGISKSFLVTRQYYKNLGKQVAVITDDGLKTKGVLTEIKEDGIIIDISPFLSNKQKKEQTDTLKFLKFNNIKEAKIILSF